ncbi:MULTISPECIES: lysophospholipid acyltransferase family protein [Gordonia]|uniref:Lysophospholipid acyltransferase family protein n=1 Tax=Gordonia cholesterolivorans TaxID=559625 RepID=A0ABN3HXC0_9ACTN|nr:MULTISPECIES: lysophospholipid acyltransferase family protein [Gordonia]KJR08250.1 acyltransferase [Gordonia sihwensis]KXT56103.1 acyltransferase [Gordonia sp. QH-12]
MEPVYRTLEGIAGSIMLAQGVRRRYFGLENVPAAGGGVVVINHTSYVDFIPAGLGLHRRGRRGRYLIKSEVMDLGIMRFLVKHARAVPVDRSAGGDAYRSAVDALRGGELIVVYPESTVSRSFELKEFKSGAVRMAAEAGVPVIPTIVWGAQRQWTKGAKRRIGFHRIPIDVEFGAPMTFSADEDPAVGTARLRETMTVLLHRVQDRYPEAPAGADWLPERLGGSAPTPAEALVIEDAEAAEKARRRAAKRGSRSE